MNKNLRIAIAQINSTVGDIEGNCRKILSNVRDAKQFGAYIVVFPELAVCGYPPEDLLLKPSFTEENLRAIKALAVAIEGITAIVGFVDRTDKELHNSAAIISGGKIKSIYRKMHLPNYSVFDEERYFKEGASPTVFAVGGIKCGVNICEDIWHHGGAAHRQAKKGAQIIFVINASPYYMNKIRERERIVAAQARANKVWVCYTNLVGGQDELVFDGQSFIADNKGNIAARAAAFKEELVIADIDLKGDKASIIYPAKKPARIILLRRCIRRWFLG